MNYRILILLCIGFSWVNAQLFPNLGGQRAGISAMSFLKIDISPRSAGMAGAQNSLTGDGYSAFWNPAAMPYVKNKTFTASNVFWVAGINHSFFSAIIPTKKKGTFAFSTSALNAGAMEKRTEYQPNGTGEYFYAYNVSAALSYSKKMTEWFSYGLSLKYLNETLDTYVANTFALDLGFLYKTDLKDLSFAVNLSNFGPDSRLRATKKSDNKNLNLDKYPVPTLFSIGISMIPVKKDNHQLLVAFQLNHPNDNSENFRLGLEYSWKDLLKFRAGYKMGIKDQNFPTFGLGIKSRVGKHPLDISYAVEPTKFLGIMHRVGLSFSINQDKRSDVEKPKEEIKENTTK